jgi:hypothetical protein
VKEMTNNQDVTNLLISRNIILEAISFIQQIRTELLFQENIREAEFNQIFE